MNKKLINQILMALFLFDSVPQTRAIGVNLPRMILMPDGAEG